MNIQKIITFRVLLVFFFASSIFCERLDILKSTVGRQLSQIDKQLFIERHALSINPFGTPLHLECKKKVAVSLLEALKVCIMARNRLEKWDSAKKIDRCRIGEARSQYLVLNNRIKTFKQELMPFVLLLSFKSLLSQIFKFPVAEQAVYECLIKERQALSEKFDAAARARRK